MQTISEQFLQSINCFKDQTKFGSIKFLILQSLYCAKSTTNGQENSFVPLRKTKGGERLWGRGRNHGGSIQLETFAQLLKFFSCVPRNLKYERLQKDQPKQLRLVKRTLIRNHMKNFKKTNYVRQVSSQEKTYFSALKLRILESIYGKFILAYSAVTLQNK